MIFSKSSGPSWYSLAAFDGCYVRTVRLRLMSSTAGLVGVAAVGATLTGCWPDPHPDASSRASVIVGNPLNIKPDNAIDGTFFMTFLPSQTLRYSPECALAHFRDLRVICGSPSELVECVQEDTFRNELCTICSGTARLCSSGLWGKRANQGQSWYVVCLRSDLCSR